MISRENNYVYEFLTNAGTRKRNWVAVRDCASAAVFYFI